MRMSVRSMLALLLPLALTACFSSEEPLISEAESVTPVAPGRYLYGEGDEANLYVLVTVNGNVTVVTSSDEDGKTEDSAVLIRNLRDDYFVAMDRSGFDYSLIRVHDDKVDEYQEDAYCKKFQDLAKKRGVTVESLGVVKATDGEFATCYFDSFDKLSGALEALLDEKVLEIGVTYRRTK